MKQFDIFFLIIFFIFSCQPQEDTKTPKNQTQTNANKGNKTSINKKKTKQLIIEGENIWVRETPITGEVIMKLNSGNICEILEVGEEVQVRNMLDKWYKIEFNDTIGWIFGSQTNLKTGKTIKIEDFDTFIKNNAENILKQNFANFIHKAIGINIFHNPGVFTVIDTIKSARIPLYDIKINPKNVFGMKPKGDFCDAYPNIKNGIYYWQIKEKDLPASSDMTNPNEVKSKRLTLPKQYKNNKIQKVQLIENEYHKAYFYFININTSWYLLCEDYVDCSA